MSARDQVVELEERISRDIIGQERIVERLLLGLLANGNLLVEGLPGLAKTRAVKSLARHLDAGLSRIQFTPDLLPSDVTGTEVYHQVDGRGEFRFEAGPIFNNLILAEFVDDQMFGLAKELGCDEPSEEPIVVPDGASVNDDIIYHPDLGNGACLEGDPQGQADRNGEQRQQDQASQQQAAAPAGTIRHGHGIGR